MKDRDREDGEELLDVSLAEPLLDNRIPGEENRHVGPGTVMQVLFLLCVVGLAVFRATDWVQTLALSFVSIVLEALPFMLIGSLVGGFIEVFVPREWITGRLSGRPVATTLAAAAMGLVFPVCECAIVPVVRRLLRKGVPPGAAVAFLLGAPIVNPIVAASTLVAYTFSWRVMLLRIALGYVVAVGVGLCLGGVFSRGRALVAELENAGTEHDCGCGHGDPAAAGIVGKIHSAVLHAAGDFLDVGRFLVVGAFVAAVLGTLVPRQLLAGTASVSVVSVGLMMLLAITLNLCSEADAFVAASFRGIVPLQAQMAFMVLGPMFDIKLLLMYQKVFTKRAILTLSCLTIVTVFAVITLWTFFCVS